MAECHCETINEFMGSAGPDPMSDAGAGVYAELDALMIEDIQFHDAARQRFAGPQQQRP